MRSVQYPYREETIQKTNWPTNATDDPSRGVECCIDGPDQCGRALDRQREASKQASLSKLFTGNLWIPRIGVEPSDLLRVHLRINESSEPSRHQLDHGDIYKRGCGFGMAFEIPCHAPVCGDPGECTLDNPTLG